MWKICFVLSVASLIGIWAAAFGIAKRMREHKKRFSTFYMMAAGVVVSSLFYFFPIFKSMENADFLGVLRSLLMTGFTSMQIFTLGTEAELITDALERCPDALDLFCKTWSTVIFILSPIFTFGFVMSLFRNLSANLRYFSHFFKDVYVFSELNDKSIVLATDVSKTHKRASIVFTDYFDDNDEKSYELGEKAGAIGAICFKKDISAINFALHSRSSNIYFFAIGSTEKENIDQALGLMERYNGRKNTHLYVFSTGIEGELLLTSANKGEMKLRRVNEVRSLINRILYERGEALFENAVEAEDGVKQISAVIIGMGHRGREMLKALTWFCQMDGYRVEINAFDSDPLAEERFTALAPELMSSDYNDVYVDGEAQYKIKIHTADVTTASFARSISELKNTSYVFVAIGDDSANVETAINLRMLFERIGIHPIIHAVVKNSQQKKALSGITNYRGQRYDLELIGDLESSYSVDVIIDSELEADALARHMKWGNEEEFWTYEYNYRSSVASAIHLATRIKLGTPGADKKAEELTEEERNILETVEHRRWNAYMRAEGYVYSGSKDKKSRNDLAKMHHDLVSYSELSDEERRKDSKVGTKA